MMNKEAIIMTQFNLYRDFVADRAVYSFNPYDAIFRDLNRQYSGEERKAAGPWAIVTAPVGAEVAEDATGMTRLYLPDGASITAGELVADYLVGDKWDPSELGIQIEKVTD